MIAFVRKNLRCLILKHTSPPVCRSPVSFSFSLHFFSTSTESKLGISPRVFDILRHKYDFSPELALRVASELSHLKTPEKAESILSFFKEFGFSNTQLVKIVKYKPRFLAAGLEGCIKPKIKFLQDMGFSSDDICYIISSNPSILYLNLKNNIIPSLSALRGLLGSNNEVKRVIRKAPRFLSVNLENNVLPNVEFLKSCGIPMERIRIILHSYSSSLLLKPAIIRKSAEKAKEMGLNASSKTFIYAIPTIASMSNEAWELKLQAFRNLGFSDGDILAMFRKTPKVFCGSMEKINKVKEVLLATGKFNLFSIVNYPSSLSSSLEKRYIPRLRILGILESRNLIKEWPTLATVSVLSDDKFFDRFIRPYSNEASDIYFTKSSGNH